MKKLFAVMMALCLCVMMMATGFAEADDDTIFVLMNIPYMDFYAAEADNTETMDAVSSATFNKPRTGGLAGGSYHVDPKGSDITGVIFPVQMRETDLPKLAGLGGVEITDASSVEITVTNRGQETTTAYTGRDALFEAPSYSWYVLTETPSVYKTMSADGSFDAVHGEVTMLEGDASCIYDRHADMVITVTGVDEALAERNVSAVVLVAEDGTKAGLKHIENLWRKTEIGFAMDSRVYETLKGKRISRIAYYTTDALYAVDVNLTVSDDELLPRLNGTYIDLFPEFAKEEYKDYWMECIAVWGIEGETAEGYYIAMTQGFMGTLKGQAAIDAYSSDPTSMVFDCYLENGLQKITVNGDVISGTNAEGIEVFRHAYAYLENVDVTFFGQPTGTQLRVYATEDPDAGMFTYFAFADDTIAETQHVEFRYGATLENIGSYDEGEYAYWLVGAINDNYKENQIKDCIKLFVDENLGEHENASQNTLTGAGTQEDPYIITNPEELIAFAASVNSGETFGYYGQFIRLDSDLDLSGVSWNPIGNLNDTENYSTMFMGTFDGNGHTISNLSFESNGPLIGSGLFGVSMGSIQNLDMRDCSVSATGLIAGDDQADGIIVGYNMGGTVNHCSVSNSRVSGLNCVGIIAGGSGGIVTDCTVTDCDVIILGDNDFSDGLKQCDVAECGGLVVGGAFGGTVSNCTASGTITAEGNEPVGLGGIAGCLEMMNEVTSNTVKVTITTKQGGHAIGGLCGYAGTHSDAARILAETGVEVINYPSLIHDCAVEAILNVPGATHVGGMIGTNLYFFGEETIWAVADCSVKAEINGPITPGALAGRAENSTFENCEMDVFIDGMAAENSIGTTDRLYESLDQ